MSEVNLMKLGDLLARLKELHEESLFEDNEQICVHLWRGSVQYKCRIVGVYLDFSSSKEEVRIDLFPIDRK